MNELIIYCKSYNKDVDRAKILLESVLKYNKDNIPFYISVPSEDIQLFKNTLGTTGYILITDENIVGQRYIQDWKTQQIIKSSFWKLGLSYNNLMIDSDSYFIKPFEINDFIVDRANHIPYTLMHEQKDLFAWTAKYCDVLGFDPQKSFNECRQPIQALFDRPGRAYDFGPGPMIFNSKVWESLEEKYLKPNDMTFADLISNVASEFTWYGEWLLTDKTIPIWPIEPMFKFFHYLPEYQMFKQLGFTEEHWAKNYLGVVMQSSSNLPLKY
jgi:hypothetical protein